MDNIGKILIAAGIIIAVIGCAILLFNRFNIPFGKLPGDIVIKTKNITFYFPVITSILISIIISIVVKCCAKRQ